MLMTRTGFSLDKMCCLAQSLQTEGGRYNLGNERCDAYGHCDGEQRPVAFICETMTVSYDAFI